MPSKLQTVVSWKVHIPGLDQKFYIPKSSAIDRSMKDWRRQMAMYIQCQLRRFLSLDINQFWISDICSDQIRLRLRLLGGKGGFGARLKAHGKSMKPMTGEGEQESCRNLQGQRLADVTARRELDEYARNRTSMLEREEQSKRAKLQRIIDAADQPMQTVDNSELDSALEKTAIDMQSAVLELFSDNELQSLTSESDAGYVDDDDDDKSNAEV